MYIYGTEFYCISAINNIYNTGYYVSFYVHKDVMFCRFVIALSQPKTSSSLLEEGDIDLKLYLYTAGINKWKWWWTAFLLTKNANANFRQSCIAVSKHSVAAALHSLSFLLPQAHEDSQESLTSLPRRATMGSFLPDNSAYELLTVIGG